MKKFILFPIIAISLIVCLLFSGCQSGDTLQDGYYTAEVAEYSHGWKEFVTICVQNNEIVTVEYNAKNPSGFIKSWDIAYMRTMNPLQGTYPNRYTRTYAADFLEKQSANNIDAVTGASSSGVSFRLLAQAVLDKAKAGDKTLAIVTVPEN